MPDELLLPLMPDELEPEPEEAVFSFGWPVAWSRQWVAAEIEPELVPDELLPDWAPAARTLPPRKIDASNKVFRFIERSYGGCPHAKERQRPRPKFLALSFFCSWRCRVPQWRGSIPAEYAVVGFYVTDIQWLV
jgi:hypothetical protein